jgi:endonuclease/exonuclease/phosphatase family metal-dependent hydrolase
VWNIHPAHDVSDDARRAQLMQDLFRAGKPDIILGDFNAGSSEDTYDKKHLLTGFSRFMKQGAKAKVNDLLKGALVNTLLKEGYRDAFLAAGKPWQYTMPSDLRSKHKDSGVRIDFIFVKKGIKVIDAGILKNKDTEIASDHYPVYAVIEV